jgi:hypothetical protein
MGAVRRLVDELRRRGLVVHEWPGWDGRGNEGVTQIDPKGGIVHHTGSSYGSAYPELVSSSQPWANRGCLCNFAGNADGSLTVIASGLAYHAGKGAGPSLGPLAPYRSWLNGRTVGLEIVYPGTKPMTDAQYRTAQIWAKTVADLFGGGDIECVRAHAETNGNAPGGDGKYDPGYAPGKTIDMKAFRAGALSVTEDDVAVEDVVQSWYGPRFRENRNYAEVIHRIEDLGNIVESRVIDLQERVASLEERLATGTGYSLEQIAQAVVAELKKPGN